MNTERLGSQIKGATFPDVIINVVEGTATNRVAGFAQIVHNPRELKTIVDTLAQQEIPLIFADAVLLRRSELQQINDIWDFPLNMTCETTVPLPWTICEATRRGNGQGANSYEYNIMRIIDFIGYSCHHDKLLQLHLRILRSKIQPLL